MVLIEYLKAILFGVVEGITEWLPISSTGHLILLNELVSFQGVTEGFYDRFEVVVQLGVIMAVVLLYWKTIWPLKRSRETGRIALRPRVLRLWGRIIISCVPAVIVGLLFDEISQKLFYNHVSVAIALIVFGVAFIAIETLRRERKPRVTALSGIDCRLALLIGVFQIIAAVFPGTSRSGATIVGALLLGVSREIAAEYTFFLAIPVMFGASLLKMLQHGFTYTGLEIGLLLTSMAVAFLVSVLVIRFMMNYIRRRDFKVFGWYRIALGALVLLFYFVG